MSGPDGGLRALFRKHLKSGVHWQSVETGLVARGVPDSNFCCQGIEGWIEFKRVKRGWRVPLRPEQVSWIDARVRHGGLVWVATWVTANDLELLYLHRGQHAIALKSGDMRRVPHVCFNARVPGKWPWNAVLSEILEETVLGEYLRRAD